MARALTREDREEALSRVYARAVSAGAGYVTAECDFDRDGVDLQIRAGGTMRPAVDLQLKATVNLRESADGHYRFALMRVEIRDADALRAVSPAALKACALASGWRKLESYGDHSDVYAADEMPEIILPRTERLGDYASVVARLIDTFARIAATDELSLYRDLVIADRDVVRVRVAETDDGSLAVNSGVDLITGARDLLPAAACSLREPQPLYRAGANKEASDLPNRIRVGQTEHGSFAVTLLAPWEAVGFGSADAPILREAARMFRSQEPQPDTLSFGLLQRLKRDETEALGGNS